ncbi:MAG: hypothetical protein ACM3OC_10095 [Deltaproteobacteria bacterium]
MKKLSSVIFLAFLLSGCVPGGFHEAVRGVEGKSTRILTDTRPGAAAREFACSSQDCREKVRKSLDEMGAYTYATEGDLTAVYVSERDTTPVGVFVTAVGEDKTRVEVSSPSTYAKDMVAQKLFDSLDRKLRSKKVDIQLDSVEGKK